MSYYRCGPTAVGSRASWAAPSPVERPALASSGRPLSAAWESPAERPSSGRPLSAAYDRIFSAFERSNAYQVVDRASQERTTAHADIVVNRRLSSSLEPADCALAAYTPDADDDYFREKVLYSQERQLYPLQEDLADWINTTLGITYLTGENFLDVLDNGVELCQLAAAIHDRAKEAIDQGLIVGPVPSVRGRCWQRAARRSFFSRDNTENFITFCRELGVHDNLLFESDDLVLHNQPRQVILCLLEVARLATRYGLEPPGLVQLEREIALEEQDSGIHCSSAQSWQFRDAEPHTDKSAIEAPPTSPDQPDNQLVVDNADAESTKSEGTVGSTDSDVPLRPTNELDKRVQLVTRLMQRGCNCGAGKCSKLLKVKKVGEGRYNIAGRNVFIRLLKGRHMMVRVGGGWDTLEHFLSRHEPCQVRLVAPGRSARPASAALGNAPERTPSPPAPAESPASSISGKISPVPKAEASSGKSSPRPSSKASERSSPITQSRRSSTPVGVKVTPKSRTGLTLPLRADSVDSPVRTRKQSAPPSFSTPSTPRTRNKPAPTLNAPKKSRSMSLALAPEKKSFCGTERLNQAKSRSNSLAGTPVSTLPRKSHSLASTPVGETKKIGSNYGKKTRSMSLAHPIEFKPLSNKSISVNITGPMTQAAIEESIRLSLAATIVDCNAPKKPFLHIKAKYRSPPPREVPPR